MQSSIPDSAENIYAGIATGGPRLKMRKNDET
jgi:hypothetical protein